MFINYVDEAGCLGPVEKRSTDIQPVFSLVGVTFNQAHLTDLTRDFLDLKQQFFPELNESRHELDQVLIEIKGSEISRSLRVGNNSEKKHSLLFLSSLLSLVEHYEGNLIGRIYIKPVGGEFDGIKVYTSACQSLCEDLQRYLEAREESGLIIMDSRNHGQNTQVAHSIFTQKFQQRGDVYPNLLEMPVFGHSDNHSGIQISDLVNSAILYPMACVSYCLGSVDHPHVSKSFKVLADKFGRRVRKLQLIGDKNGKSSSIDGIRVIDVAQRRGTEQLF